MNKKISEVIDIIHSLPLGERQEIFAKEISELKELKSALENTENIFSPHEEKAWIALQKIIIFFRRATGYNCGWVAEEALKHCSNAGRKIKHTSDKRLSNCIIIYHISKRGCSVRQAVILLAKMINDKNVSPESTQKELTDSYREYRKKDLFRRYEEIHHIGWVIADMLNFDLSQEYSSHEKSFIKAREAHKAFWQDVINLMNKYHPIIAKYDKDYPEIFGCVIEWLNQSYDNPIEYFYKPPSHQTIALRQRKKYLSIYIEAINFFQDSNREIIE